MPNVNSHSRLINLPLLRYAFLVLVLSSCMVAQQPAPVPTPPRPPSSPTPVPRPPQSESRPAQAQPGEEPTTTFRVDVKLVNVFATVTDQHGAPVGNLTKGDFELFEDEHRENISVFRRESELPLSIVLSIDTSLSTRKDLKLELESARKFAHDILRPIDALSIYEFNEVVSEIVHFTSDLKRIDRSLERLRVGAATALYDAVYLGAQSLTRRQGRKVMVLITDGGDTASRITYEEAMRAAAGSEVILYSIIMVPVAQSAGRNTGGEHALIQLSADTGGKHYYATTLTQLDKAFERISEELRTQYLLAYYPSRRVAASDFRRIEVRLKSKPEEYRVRHRSGYFTSPSE